LLAKRVLGVAAIGAAVGVGVPVLASGATERGASERCSSEDSNPRSCTVAPAEAAPFIVTDGAKRPEVGIEPRALTAADGAKLARTGSITLAIEASGPGTVSAIGTSQVGNAMIKAGTTAPDGSEGWVEVGRDFERITEPASVTAEKAGVVQLTLRLTPAARAAYAAGADETMLLRISSSNAPAALITFLSMASG
jgi:Na+-translocating ferredoxin:NAD+ oxidoreductase RnfC subunit